MSEVPLKTELRLPSRLGFEKVAMQTAATVAGLMGFSNARIEDLKTAVSEACINAIEHGNKLDASQIVSVEMSMGEHALEVRVTDQGAGLVARTATAKAPDMEAKMAGLEDARGMGIFLIRALVDEAEWVTNQPHGSYARLVIYLDPHRNSQQ